MGTISRPSFSRLVGLLKTNVTVPFPLFYLHCHPWPQLPCHPCRRQYQKVLFSHVPGITSHLTSLSLISSCLPPPPPPCTLQALHSHHQYPHYYNLLWSSIPTGLLPLTSPLCCLNAFLCILLGLQWPVTLTPFHEQKHICNFLELSC